jgi:hypothetical protein
MSMGILLYLDLEFWEWTPKTLTPSLQENTIYFTTRSYLTLTKVHGTQNKNFEIRSYECPLADEWMENLRAELKEQLPAYGHEPDEIVVEKIGL